MNRVLLILSMVLIALLGSTVGASASSPRATSIINPEAVVSPAGSYGTYLQNNGVCGSNFQRARGWMESYGGTGVDYIEIQQRLQWWNGYRWKTQKTWYTYRYTNGNYATLVNKHTFYYSGASWTHTTRIKSTFLWVDNGYTVGYGYGYSGTCS